MNFKELLPLTGKEIPIEFRLFETSLVITILILYFYTTYGLFFGYQWPVMTIYASSSIIYTGLYIAQKKKIAFRWLTLIYYATALVLLSIAWLPSGGMKGAITNMFILVFVSGLLVLNLKDFLIFIIASLLIVTGYTFFEFNYPNAAAPYLDQDRWMIDISVSNLIMFIVLGLTMFIFKKEYLREKEKLKVTNGKLEMEREKAEAAGKTKSMFLANISHEMRTPLNGITGSSELLRQTDMSENQMEILANLTYSNDLLNSLISDVLDFTMMESGTLGLIEKEFNLHQMVEDIARIFEPQITESEGSVSFSYSLEKEVPRNVKGDEERLKRLLIHLVKNAIKFTCKGGISIAVKQVKSGNKTSTVRFEVEDTGVGISEQNKANIFEPFQNFSGDNSEGGFGLGLNICKRLVEAMGGEMGFTSTYGKGTFFYFEVPLKTGLDTQIVYNELSFKHLKVLIAEDQQINQVITTKMLQNMGVTNIDIAVNGLEAVEKIQKKNYDLVLMDIRMPLMDGIEATREIFLIKGTQKPIIIAVTANALEMDKKKCLEVGMHDFINKPFTREILQKSIRSAINMRMMAEG